MSHVFTTKPGWRKQGVAQPELLFQAVFMIPPLNCPRGHHEGTKNQKRTLFYTFRLTHQGNGQRTARHAMPLQTVKLAMICV